MNRRQFLALVGASAATGCTSLALPGTGAPSECPPFPGERGGQTICDGKERDVPVYLHAKSDTVGVANGTLDFAFVNTADEGISYGPCFWTLYKESNDGWQTVRPIEGDAVGKLLPAGGSHELTLHVGQQDTTSTACTPYTVSELAGGRHLFGVQGATPDGTTTLFLASFRAEPSG